MPWSGMLDGMAEKYNGNLKTLLLFLDGRLSASNKWASYCIRKGATKMFRLTQGTHMPTSCKTN